MKNTMPVVKTEFRTESTAVETEENKGNEMELVNSKSFEDEAENF
jgi:hypothetical protein